VELRKRLEIPEGPMNNDLVIYKRLQEGFEKAYHHQRLRVTYPTDGHPYEGECTAALLDENGAWAVIAVLGPGGLENADWRTYNLESPTELCFFEVLSPTND
jgi:hypothetical protein